MCGTCGCGETNGVSVLTPQEHKHQHDGHQHDGHQHDGHHHHDHHHDHDHEHAHGHHHHYAEPSHGNRTLELERDILQQNDVAAARNRGYFEALNLLSLNLVSSPGSGKTSFLERTISDLKNELDFYVIEGDQRTFNDADRIDALKVPVVQINTGTGCHLESDMIYDAVKKLSPKANGILMIENVGNLVCPALFDLGEKSRVVIISTTEGDDKPIKYPTMFEGSDLCIINKIDLLPYVSFNLEKAKDYARRVNPAIEFIEVSATTGEGMTPWYQWLKTTHESNLRSESLA